MGITSKPVSFVLFFAKNTPEHIILPLRINAFYEIFFYF